VDHRGEGWYYSTDDRWMAAVTSGYLVCGITLIPGAVVLSVLDAWNIGVVLVWVVLPGVVGYIAPGLFAGLIRPSYPYFGRSSRPSESPPASRAVPSSRLDTSGYDAGYDVGDDAGSGAD
jgi:hypothetical protein